MSDEFLKPKDELERTAKEIASLRRELRDAAATLQGMNALLGRIEKRLRAAFPNYPEPDSDRSESVRLGRREAIKGRDELMSHFESLRAATKEGGDAGFHSQIEKILPNDLCLLAQELGIPGGKRLSAKKAREMIRKRVQESLMLSMRDGENDKGGAPDSE